MGLKIGRLSKYGRSNRCCGQGFGDLWAQYLWAEEKVRADFNMVMAN